MTRPPAKFAHALRLRCLYCGQTPFLREGSWFQCASGCGDCGYDYEREPGYFSGAFQLIIFTVVSLSALALAATLVHFAPGLGSTWVVVACSLLIGIEMVAMYPWALAFWMWMDHRLHPLPAAGDSDLK